MQLPGTDRSLRKAASANRYRSGDQTQDSGIVTKIAENMTECVDQKMGSRNFGRTSG